MKPLHRLTAAELNAAYRNRELKPTELVSALIRRVEEKNPGLNAFISLDADAAMAEARLADSEIAAGRFRGPLHGVPVGIKDIIDISGTTTSCHSKVMQGHKATEDAEVIRRLRGAGAIIFGKLSLHEFAIGGPSFDLPYPPARNPWNTAHHPGGSSSGSGSAVAAGLVPVALGTDTGGSIRNPASACGIVGLKPTYGAVSRRGVFPLSYTLDHVGPLTRTVRDAALVLEAIAGHDARDPGSAPVPSSDYTAGLDGGASGLRIGYVRHFHEQDMVADPEVRASLDAAVEALGGAGATVEDVTLAPLTEINGIQRIITLSEAWAVHATWLRERPQDYGQFARRRLMSGAFLSAGDYVMAQQQRARIISGVNDALRRYDVLLTANAMETACLIDDDEANARTYPRQARAPFNLTGHPAIAVMCGLSTQGMPISLQFVGRYHDEARMFRAAAAFECVSVHADVMPPCYA